MSATERVNPRMDDLARRVAERLLAHDHKGVLDILHGQRRDDDPNFDRNFLDALRNRPEIRRNVERFWVEYGVRANFDSTEAARKSVSQMFAPGDATLFNAYLNNSGGVSRPEDIAQIASQNGGYDISTIRDMYVSLRERYPDPVEYRNAVAALDRQFAERYGGRDRKSLHARLIDKLGSDDRRDYLAARHGAEEALKLYNASGEEAIATLMANIHRTDQLGKDFHKISARDAGDPGDAAHRDTDAGESNALVRTLTGAAMHAHLRGRLSESEMRRASILLDTSRTPQQRAEKYLDETLKGYADGKITGEVLRDSLQMLTAGENAPTNAGRLADTLKTSVERAQARARIAGPGGRVDTVTDAMLKSIVTARRVDGPGVAVADIRNQLEAARADRDKLLAVAAQIAALSPEDRAALRAAIPRDKIADYLRRGDRNDRGVGGATRMREIDDGGLVQRLNDAIDGRVLDAKALLKGAAPSSLEQRTALPEEVLEAIRRLPIGERGAFPRLYGGEAFERDVSRLPADIQRQIRAAVTTPTFDHSPAAMAELARRARDLSDSEQSGLTGWLTTAFGRTTPVLNDATRALVRAADNMRDANAANSDRLIDELMNAQLRFMQAVETGAGERREIALDAAVTLTTAIAGGWGGLSVAAITKAAARVGITAVSTKAAMLGDAYTAHAAMQDFLTYAGGDAVFMGTLRGARGVHRRVFAPGSPTRRPDRT